MGDVNGTNTNTETGTGWERGALWLALAAGTVMLVIRLVLDSEPAEAVALALLSGVVVFGLAFLAHRPR